MSRMKYFLGCLVIPDTLKMIQMKKKIGKNGFGSVVLPLDEVKIGFMSNK